MSKIWGVMLFSVFTITPFVVNSAEANQCKQYLTPKQWQPLLSADSQLIDIQSNFVEAQSTDSIEYKGNVEINSSKLSLFANSAVIDKTQGMLHAEGPLIYQDQFSHIKSNSLNANLTDPEITLLGATYQLTQQQGKGDAERLYADDGIFTLTNSSFTTCLEEKPFWALEASTITLSKTQGWGETYNAVFKILDTPVIYIPYFTFPIDDRRKTGLLMPTISSSDRYGVEVITPFYWNIASNYDATITPRVMSNNGLQINTEFRYLHSNNSGLLAVEYLGNDKAEPELDARYLVHFKHEHIFSEQWRADIDLTNISDDNYLTDLHSGYANKTDTQLARTGNLYYLSDNWIGRLKFQNFEVLGKHREAYSLMPQIQFETRNPFTFNGISTTVKSELSHFRNDAETFAINEATRFHIEPKVSYHYQDYAWSFLSEASILHTRYNQKGMLSGTKFKENVSRTIPRVRLHAKVNFERNTSLFVLDGIQTLEPQLQYLYSPKREQDSIGLFDTTKMQDDFFGLFREQRFSGIDRIAEANQFTVGATTRVFDKNNIEKFNFSAGQIIYLNDKTSPTAQSINEQINNNSLFAAETMINFYQHWYFSAGMQYDADDKKLEASYSTIDYRGDKNQLLQLNHRYANDVSGYEIDQIGLFTSIPINDKWQLVGSYHRDLNSSKSVESLLALQYESCCWAIQVIAKRQIETDLNQIDNFDSTKFDASIGFDFILKGLGGSDSSLDANRIFSQGIFGYRKPYFLNN